MTQCISVTTEETIVDDACPTDGRGIDEEIIDRNTLVEKSVTPGGAGLVEKEKGFPIVAILIPLLLLGAAVGYLYWRRKEEARRARVADSAKNVEDGVDEEAAVNALLGHPEDDTQAGLLGPDLDDDAKDNFETVLEDRKENADALDALRRQSLAKGASDEEAEKLLRELDDKLQDVDNLMLEEQEAQKQLLEDQKRRRRERRAKQGKKGTELDEELQRLKDDEEAAEAER